MDKSTEDFNILSGRNLALENSQEYQISDFIAIEQSQIDSLLSKSEFGEDTESYGQVLPVASVRQSLQPSSSRPRYHHHPRYPVKEKEEEVEEDKEGSKGARGRARNLRFYTGFEDDFDESDMLNKPVRME